MVKKIIFILPLIISCHVNNDWTAWTIKKDNYAATGAYIYTHQSNNVDFYFQFDTTAVYTIEKDTLIKRDTLIYKYITIEYYKKVEILPYSIDSIMDKKINEYFDKIEPKTIKLY
jgi:hypothetical protein